MVRWPGRIEAGSVSNEIMHHMDWLPTFVAAAGEANINEQLLTGYDSQALGRSYRVHLDGYNFLPLLTGQTDQGPRDEIFYFTDDGDLASLRYRDWKLVFLEQRVTGGMEIWAEPFTELRFPKIFNLRRDPYEHADRTSNTYWDWVIDRAFMLVPAQSYVADFLETFQEYPASPDCRELLARAGHGEVATTDWLIEGPTGSPERGGYADDRAARSHTGVLRGGPPR